MKKTWFPWIVLTGLFSFSFAAIADSTPMNTCSVGYWNGVPNWQTTTGGTSETTVTTTWQCAYPFKYNENDANASARFQCMSNTLQSPIPPVGYTLGNGTYQSFPAGDNEVSVNSDDVLAFFTGFGFGMSIGGIGSAAYARNPFLLSASVLLLYENIKSGELGYDTEPLIVYCSTTEELWQYVGPGPTSIPQATILREEGEIKQSEESIWGVGH